MYVLAKGTESPQDSALVEGIFADNDDLGFAFASQEELADEIGDSPPCSAPKRDREEDYKPDAKRKFRRSSADQSR